MRRSLPRLVRGHPASSKTTAASTEQVRPNVPTRSGRKAGSAALRDESKPIYTRFLPEDVANSKAKPSIVLEAELHAKVDSEPGTAFRDNPRVRYAARPLPRIVPAGTAMHLPNEHTVTSGKGKTLGPRKLEKSEREFSRPKPTFRKLNLDATSLYEKYLQSIQNDSTTTSGNTAARLSSTSAPASRRKYSTMPSSVASTSNVRIEDMDHFQSDAPSPMSLHSHHQQAIHSTAEEHEGTLSTGQAEYSAEDAIEGMVRDQHSDSAGQEEYTAGSYVTRLPDPESPAQMVGFMKHAARSSITTRNLLRLYDWHRRYAELQTTASFNLLLQLAYKVRNLKAFNQILLQDMPTAGVARDNVTWDLLMETWARNGRWDKVVDVWSQRRDANMPLNRIGWTRVAQAATKKGTTSLSSNDVKRSMSPIYSALYDLPKGVRQLQLYKMMQAQKMDVDQMLALMMPEDLHPLDYQAALIIAHRLVKQTRWREAEDVVALWLDRTEDAWVAYESEGLPQNQVETISSQDLDDEAIDAQDDENNRALDKAKAKRIQKARGLLHVLLEGLVISRNTPDVVHAYIDNFLSRYQRTGVYPTYHTLFFVMTAFRVRPIKTRFSEAYKSFVKLEELYRPPSHALMDKYGLSRCLRQLQSYGLFTVESYSHVSSRRGLVESVTFDLRNIGARLSHAELRPSRDTSDEHRRITSPPRHTLIKERYKSNEGTKSLDLVEERRQKRGQRPSVLGSGVTPVRSTLSREDDESSYPPVPRWDSYRL